MKEFHAHRPGTQGNNSKLQRLPQQLALPQFPFGPSDSNQVAETGDSNLDESSLPLVFGSMVLDGDAN